MRPRWLPAPRTCRTAALVAAMAAMAVTLSAGCGSPVGGTATPAAGQAGPATEAPPDTSSDASDDASTEDPTTAAAAPTVDACELLTLADAQALAGTPLDPGVAGTPQNPQCTYTGPPTGPIAQVEVYVGDGAKKSYDIDVELAHEFTPVPGIADEAHLEENAVFFRKGTTWVGLRLVLLNDPAVNRDPLIALARTLATRL